MKMLFMLAIISIFILSSCTKNSTNPVNTETIPSTPTQSLPINASTGVAVLSNLTWNSGSGTTSYTLQVSANSSFTSFVYNQSGLTSLNQLVPALAALTKYYWRVGATNGYGTSGWSDTWSFTTQ